MTGVDKRIEIMRNRKIVFVLLDNKPFLLYSEQVYCIRFANVRCLKLHVTRE